MNQMLEDTEQEERSEAGVAERSSGVKERKSAHAKSAAFPSAWSMARRGAQHLLEEAPGGGRHRGDDGGPHVGELGKEPGRVAFRAAGLEEPEHGQGEGEGRRGVGRRDGPGCLTFVLTLCSKLNSNQTVTELLNHPQTGCACS